MSTPPIYASHREFDAIVAALRFWQEVFGKLHGYMSEEQTTWLRSIASEHGDPLREEEIDTLVERINLR